jgi:hypothetical protein
MQSNHLGHACAGLTAALAILTCVACSAEDAPSGAGGSGGAPGHVTPGDPETPARLAESVHRLSVDFVPRDWEHVENLDAAAEWIGLRMSQAGAEVQEQTWTAEGRTYRNVIGAFGPEGGPVVVVGAHYDALGTRPGADDNASGVAGLLEVALRIGDQVPHTRVELVAYSLEELPFFGTDSMGSAIHAASLADRGAEVVGMLNLEMIGYYSDETGSQTFPDPAMEAAYGTVGNFLAVIGHAGDEGLIDSVGPPMQGANDLEVGYVALPSQLGVTSSDHRNYWKHGWPAAVVTDTGDLRNPNRHKVSDTEDTLDYDRMAMAADAVYAGVAALALE